MLSKQKVRPSELQLTKSFSVTAEERSPHLLHKKRKVVSFDTSVTIFLHKLLTELGDSSVHGYCYLYHFLSNGWYGVINNKESRFNSAVSAYVMLKIWVPGSIIKIRVVTVYECLVHASSGASRTQWRPATGSVTIAHHEMTFIVRPNGPYAPDYKVIIEYNP